MMLSIEIFAIEIFVNHQASEHHMYFYSTECYIGHSNFLTTARRNDVGDMLRLIKKKQLYALDLFPSMHKASFSAYAYFDYLR
jgi:hypothetical protein